MAEKNWLLYLAIGGLAYYLLKKKSSPTGSPGLTGLGVGGQPRIGHPKTEQERMGTHYAMYGTVDLPPRGTGIARQGYSTGEGLGVGGWPRAGRPKSESERIATHRARYGTSELPPHGTGLRRQGLI